MSDEAKVTESGRPPEARTVRDARFAIRKAEAAIDRIRMAPASALSVLGRWDLRQAQARLRAAEREFAKADDPRLEPLAPLRPTVEKPRPATGERRRRYRCAVCMVESLRTPSLVEREPLHYKARKAEERWERVDCGEWQLVARLPRGVR